MSNNVALLLPTPTISIIGAVSTGRLTGTVTLTLPKPGISIKGNPAGNSVSLTLPTPTLQVRGTTSLVGSVRLTLPVPTLTARGDTSTVGSVSLVLPTPTLRVYGPSAVVLTLPTPTLDVIGFTGRVGTVALVLPTPTIAIAAEVPFTASVALALPKPTLVITGGAGNIGAVNLTLRGLALAAEGRTGILGTVDLVLPITGSLESKGGLQITGGELARGTVSLTLPMLYLQATGQTSQVTPQLPDGDVFPATVIHTETGALWNYTNVPFNSMCDFNGAYLAASAEGLFVLGGDTDNGALIQAAARVGITDFGTSFLKRVDRCYVGYRTSGDLVIRVFTDEVNVRDYLITQYGKEGLHGNHTRIGKGLAARYWQFEIRNQNGAAFQLNALELKPTHLRRRIGGGDA